MYHTNLDSYTEVVDSYKNNQLKLAGEGKGNKKDAKKEDKEKREKNKFDIDSTLHDIVWHNEQLKLEKKKSQNLLYNITAEVFNHINRDKDK